MLIDSHFHLIHLPVNWRPNDQLIAGLAVTVQPSEWLVAQRHLLMLTPSWRLALGIHPWYAEEAVDWSQFERLLIEHPRFAIGEIGLDGTSGRPATHIQERVFTRQLSLAHDLNRLLSLHCVRDQEQCYHRIKSVKGLRGGIIHGFTGSLVQALRWQALGFHIGIGARVLTDVSPRRHLMLNGLDRSMIHLESDAPLRLYEAELASPNDLPPYLSLLAHVLSMSESALSQQLYQNWRQLWKCFDDSI